MAWSDLQRASPAAEAAAFPPPPQPGTGRTDKPTKGDDVGIIDKLTGRAKQAAGDLADDASLRREGKHEEEKGEKKEQLDRAQNEADRKAEEVADLERKT
jgi:uncharacterized protein YjbJ (UPF0337 family)